MSPQLRKISCGKWRRCFAEEAGDERDLYFVAARSEKIQSVAGADYRLAGPAALVLVGAWLRLRAGVPESGRGKLSAIHGAWNCWHGGSVHLRLFWNRITVGPAIWIFERDAGGPSGADQRHDRADAGRSDGGDAAGHADHGGMPDSRIPAGKLDRDT